MIDLSNIEKYKENNRIEAKKATGGLPKSIWETYSAFANTLGGVILLGVEEYPDKTLHPVDLPDTDWMLSDLRDGLSDPAVVSVNILSEDDVQVQTVEGKRIIVITVPRAARSQKPVYIGGDPYSGSYFRNGEGDYRCSAEDVQAMLRGASSDPHYHAGPDGIIDCLTENVSVSLSELSRLLDRDPKALRPILAQLLDEKVIVEDEEPGEPIYRLRA